MEIPLESDPLEGASLHSFFQAIKNDISLSHIPVIVLTAKDQAVDKMKAYEFGVDSFISKPFSISLLKSRMNNILESRKQLYQQWIKLSSNGTLIRDNSANQRMNKLDMEFLKEFAKVVMDNIASSSLDMTFMQNHFHSSHSSLYRKVKTLTGLSVNEYIRKIRLNQASKCLIEEGLNVSETAFSCGFNDISYFISCFKKEFGVTPAKYIQSKNKIYSDT